MTRLRSALTLALAGLFATTLGSAARGGPYLLVNGQFSDNVVKIDLDSGADELFALYNTDDHPRNIAIRDTGRSSPRCTAAVRMSCGSSCRRASRCIGR